MTQPSHRNLMSKELLKKKRTATLRKMAKEKEIPGWDKLERPELLEALGGSAKVAKSKVKAKEEKKEKLKEEKKEEKEQGPAATPGVEEEHVPVGGKAEIMKKRLAKQPKVRILIPLEEKEKQGSTFSVTLNGFRLNIQKGVYVDVPQQVADVVMESQKQTVKAEDHKLRIKESKPELEE